MKCKKASKIMLAIAIPSLVGAYFCINIYRTTYVCKTCGALRREVKIGIFSDLQNPISFSLSDEVRDTGFSLYLSQCPGKKCNWVVGSKKVTDIFGFVRIGTSSRGFHRFPLSPGKDRNDLKKFLATMEKEDAETPKKLREHLSNPDAIQSRAWRRLLREKWVNWIYQYKPNPPVVVQVLHHSQNDTKTRNIR